MIDHVIDLNSYTRHERNRVEYEVDGHSLLAIDITDELSESFLNSEEFKELFACIFNAGSMYNQRLNRFIH
jgi:hypothetical protein